MLSIIYNNPFDKKCLDNAVLIIKGKDVEATPSIIKSVASTYAKSINMKKIKKSANFVKRNLVIINVTVTALFAKSIQL